MVHILTVTLGGIGSLLATYCSAPPPRAPVRWLRRGANDASVSVLLSRGGKGSVRGSLVLVRSGGSRIAPL
jgi:hypothetical protein